jgi:protein involved in polysaccharide export with SLBB domain
MMPNQRLGSPFVAVMRLVGCVFFGFLPTAAAQRPNPGPAYATRAMLEEQLRAQHSSEEVRLIRARLDSGDFRPNDRILLRVDGEKELSDTFTVGMDTALTLPQVGAVPLGGLLRAELNNRLTQVLARYLRHLS